MEKTQQILLPADQPQERPKLELKERVGIVEAILFVTGNAVEKREICRALEIQEAELEETLDAMESGYDFDRRGLRLLRFGAHVQLATRPDYAPYVEKLLQPVQKQSLSSAIMETLAVIAYRQPVTKAEIEQIRGVKCDYSVQSLTAKGLIEEVGRKETLGRPILYGTTDAFLRHFCISSLSELPEIDFSKLAEKLGGGKSEEEKTEDFMESMDNGMDAGV
ncbi:MAG: SMC-Scp complex subunit ScpB [Clostridia bacterium]|nr:SMC-Scp complex subunit ScpB [Clostridia bacterium]